MDDNPSRLAGNRYVAQLAAPHLPLAAFSSSEQLRMPPGLRAAPGTWSSEMELLFMVMPRACSPAPPQLCAALPNRLAGNLRVSLTSSWQSVYRCSIQAVQAGARRGGFG